MAGQNGNGDVGLTTFGSSEQGEIPFRPHGGRRPRALAYGGTSAKHLTHDDRYLYWTDDRDGTVTRLPKDGGVPLVLATDQPGAYAITLSRDHLYWANYRHEGRGSVVRMPAEGGAIELIEGGQDSPQSIAVHEDTIAWTTFGDGLATGTVAMKRLGAEKAITLATKQKQPRSILIDPDQVYWTCTGNKRPSYFTDGSIARMPRDGGRKRYLIAKDQSMPDSLVTDGEWIYWTTAAMIFEPHEPGAIFRRRKGEKRTETLVSWYEQSGHLALDATHIYWFARHGGALYRLPKDGGDVERLMSATGELGPWVVDFVVDDRCLYWTTWDSQKAGGAIFKMAK
ncbi:MAG TPA: hypothetical protein VLS89_06265 [Candidatus Nanopelagicales bacterium]|nr:hypothetical protein [Candidatus Nanopelagicales bacterium]